MAKILVTGGAGFIGLRVCEDLLHRKHEVRVLDIEGVHPSFFSDRNFLKEVEKIRGSILDANCVSNVVKGCDYVIHLAAMLGVRRTEMKKLECLNINIQGTINILEACVKEKIKKIVFSSSSEVYGEPSVIPITEDTPKKAYSVYAITKLAGEEYVKAYSERYGLDYSIVRLFNVYGPGQVAEFVIPRFIKAAMEGRAPFIYGSGEQIRCFCYVDDAVDGICRVLFADNSNGHVFNIGNDSEPITIKDLTYKVISIVGKDGLKPQFIEMTKADREEGRDIKKRVPSIAKAQRFLGFRPRVSLNEGIKMVMRQNNIVESWFEPMYI
jgi:UDP-glucose 4-epimerase